MNSITGYCCALTDRYCIRRQLLIAMPLLCLSAALAHGKLPTLDDYFRETELLGVALSPEGTKLAGIRRAKPGRYTLMIYDLATNKMIASHPEPRKGYFASVRWLNDTRLGVTTRSPRRLRRTLVSMEVGGGDARTLLVDNRRLGKGYDLSRIASVLPDDPDHILMVVWNRSFNLYKVNVYTGDAELKTLGRRSTFAFGISSTGEPEIRLDMNVRTRKVRLYAFINKTRKWRKIRSFHFADLTDDLLKNVAKLEGQTEILMLDRIDGEEFVKLHRYDLLTESHSEVVHEVEDYDIRNTIHDRFTNEIVGITYVGSRPRQIYFNEEEQQVQAHLEKLFPNGQIRITSRSRDRRRYLAFATEPWRPGSYYLYDKQENRISEVADLAPQLKDVYPASVQEIKYQTKDKTTIVGYLTIPRGHERTKLPLIVLPHGGPLARDWLVFSRDVQYWATRGYAILQPNFRGSWGYGRKFEETANGEYGGLMIDDIAAGIRALIEAGRVDTDRICAAGYSYGGYASLMLAVRTDLLKCAVSINGPVDLKLQIKKQLKSIKDKREKAEYRAWADEKMGNIKTEAEILKRQSPVHRAEEIDIPILLIHAKNDRRVFVEHAQKMQAALTKADKDVEYIELQRGGHSLWKAEQRKVLEETERFFAKYLKGPAE